MGKESNFSNLWDVLKGQFSAAIVDTDGEIDVGRCYNFTPATNAPQTEMLEEVHNERMVTVRTDLVREEFTFGLGLRGISPAGRVRLIADGDAPTIDQAYRLLRHAINGQLLQYDRKTGLPKEYRLRVTGLPQAHDSTVFPIVTSLSAVTDATSGSFILSEDYFVWVVPVYRDLDPKHGPTDANFTLANWGNLNRGVHYVYGTPLQWIDASATPANSIQSGNSIRVQFSEPTIGSLVYRPTHFAVVIGTVEDIEDGGSYVAALSAWSGASHDLTITAPGTAAFGLTPALADLIRVETIAISSETRTPTAKTEDTDYTVDRVNDVVKIKAGGGITADQHVRINTWFGANPSDKVAQGGRGAAERYEWIRLYNVRADGTDPDSRRLEGEILDFPRVNTAGMTKQLTSAAADGFHDPVPLSNIRAEVDPTLGYACQITRYRPSNAQAVDAYSDDISATAS